MPWRNTTNPYYIWLSEIILQQTRVEQGTAYYLKFVEIFPTVYDLASAKESEVLKLWQGLGYYSRARNLHFTGNYIVNELNGQFPSTYNEILKLKGVGDYTASAIASFCFDEPTAVVDGNVYRVLSRFFDIETPINSTKGIKYFKELAQELIDVDNAATHNQSIMEFGARMCKPQNPDCEKTILNLREGKGIWQGLYEFPLVESEKTIDKDELQEYELFKKIVGNTAFELDLYNNQEKIHKLSHQHLYTRFWILKVDKNEFTTINWKQINSFPVPILIHNFVEELKRTIIFSIFDKK